MHLAAATSSPSPIILPPAAQAPVPGFTQSPAGLWMPNASPLVGVSNGSIALVGASGLDDPIAAAAALGTVGAQFGPEAASVIGSSRADVAKAIEQRVRDQKVWEAVQAGKISAALAIAGKQ